MLKLIILTLATCAFATDYDVNMHVTRGEKQYQIVENGKVRQMFFINSPKEKDLTEKRSIWDFLTHDCSFKKVPQFMIDGSNPEPLRFNTTSFNLELATQSSLISLRKVNETDFEATFDCQRPENEKGEQIKIDVREKGQESIIANFGFYLECPKKAEEKAEKKQRDFEPSILVMFFAAVTIVYIAAHTADLEIFDNLSPEEQKARQLSTKMAILQVIGASCMLFVLYMFKKYLLNIMIGMISLQSVLCLTMLTEHFTKQIFGKGWFYTQEHSLPLLSYLFGPISCLQVFAFMISICTVYFWFITRNWVLNNVLGTALAITFMKTLQMTSLTPGTILLSLLFFYDIFWVFLSPYFTAKGESVMVEVATGLDVPIKLVLPHFLGDAKAGHCTMLGLGDIVIPGVFILYMKVAGEKIPELNGTKLYFWRCLAAYAASLLFCGGILFVFNAAQPALLYIVPALLGTVYLTACCRKDDLQYLNRGIETKEEKTE